MTSSFFKCRSCGDVFELRILFWLHKVVAIFDDQAACRNARYERVPQYPMKERHQRLLLEIQDERMRIRSIYGVQHHAQAEWLKLARKQLTDVETCDNVRRELVQLTACVFEWIENEDL